MTLSIGDIVRKVKKDDTIRENNVNMTETATATTASITASTVSEQSVSATDN